MKLTRGVISIILIIHVVVILFAAYRLFFDKNKTCFSNTFHTIKPLEVIIIINNQ